MSEQTKLRLFWIFAVGISLAVEVGVVIWAIGVATK
jgi:hypothetical protein